MEHKTGWNSQTTTLDEEPLRRPPLEDDLKCKPMVGSLVVSCDDDETLLLLLKKCLKVRRNLQKVEFLACWIIFLVSALCDSHVFPMIQPWMLLWLKVSTFSRALAYIVDLANAKATCHRIPLWLLLHHSGVLFGHTVNVFFLTPTCKRHIMITAHAFQSSHNTWTKKHSMMMYWANVLAGLLTFVHRQMLLSSAIIHGEEDQEGSTLALNCSLGSLLVTGAGVFLLILEKVNKSSSSSFRFSLSHPFVVDGRIFTKIFAYIEEPLLLFRKE